MPQSHLQSVKESVFSAGAGKIGDYQQCCWQVLGTGQFMPDENAQPFIGKCGQLEHVQEYRVEMVCEKDHIKKVVVALKRSHPYQQPAFEVSEILDFS